MLSTEKARSRSARHPPHATPPAARAAAVRVEAAGPGARERGGGVGGEVGFWVLGLGFRV